MRIASLFVLALVVGCGDEHPPLPPPPAEATASCVYELTAQGSRLTSTLWFNSLDQVIRIDGHDYDDDAKSYPVATYVHYDAEGRVIAQEDPHGTFTWTYSADQIEHTGYVPEVMYLVDGRVTREEWPTTKAPADRNTLDYTYDEAGHLISSLATADHGTSSSVTEYGYDPQGRVVSVKRSGELAAPLTLTYYDLGDRVVVDLAGGGRNSQHWLFDFDADHRLVREEVRSGDQVTIASYVYSEGVIEQTFEAGYRVVATGHCDPPARSFAPALPLPVRWSAQYTHFRDITTTFDNPPF